MRSYPDYFATKQDYENIMRDFPEWRKRVKDELEALKEIKDDKALRAVEQIDPSDPSSKWITEEIVNPLPKWKQKGFTSRTEIDTVITNEGKIEK